MIKYVLCILLITCIVTGAGGQKTTNEDEDDQREALFQFRSMVVTLKEQQADDRESMQQIKDEILKLKRNQTTNEESMQQMQDEILQLKNDQSEGTCRCKNEDRPLDCEDVRRQGHSSSGVYTVYMEDATKMVPRSVYCHMDTDDEGWTRILHRQDGLYDFPNQNWTQYEAGFGDASGSYWLGLKHMHQLTNRRPYKLRVELMDFEKETRYTEYSHFVVGSSSDQYKLTISGYSGDAGDSLTYHNNMAFSTIDRDNDLWSQNCAALRKGAWWYIKCGNSCLNGHFIDGGAAPYHQGIYWRYWKGWNYSYKMATMMIKQVD